MIYFFFQPSAVVIDCLADREVAATTRCNVATVSVTAWIVQTKKVVTRLYADRIGTVSCVAIGAAFPPSCDVMVFRTVATTATKKLA